MTHLIASIAEACVGACLNDKAGPTYTLRDPVPLVLSCYLEGQEVLHLRLEHAIQ